jgi:thioredoxin-related protein
MKKFILILSVFALTISCADSTKKTDKITTDNKEKSGVSAEKPLLALADFDSKAGEWIDKEVQVKGIVDHVCKHGGKKILLVNDDGDVHVQSEERFDDKLVGSEITVTGVVKEFRVDEAYCLQKEEDHQQNHKEGTDSDEMYAKKMKQITFFRDSMKAIGKDHLSFYSLDYVSHKVDKEIVE